MIAGVACYVVYKYRARIRVQTQTEGCENINNNNTVKKKPNIVNVAPADIVISKPPPVTKINFWRMWIVIFNIVKIVSIIIIKLKYFVEYEIRFVNMDFCVASEE